MKTGKYYVIGFLLGILVVVIPFSYLVSGFLTLITLGIIEEFQDANKK